MVMMAGTVKARDVLAAPSFIPWEWGGDPKTGKQLPPTDWGKYICRHRTYTHTHTYTYTYTCTYTYTYIFHIHIHETTHNTHIRKKIKKMKMKR